MNRFTAYKVSNKIVIMNECALMSAVEKMYTGPYFECRALIDNAWVTDAINAGWWDSIDALSIYFSDMLYDYKNALSCKHEPPFIGELREAVNVISTRLAAIGAPYEVYHPSSI